MFQAVSENGVVFQTLGQTIVQGWSDRDMYKRIYVLIGYIEKNCTRCDGHRTRKSRWNSF